MTCNSYSLRLILTHSALVWPTMSSLDRALIILSCAWATPRASLIASLTLSWSSKCQAALLAYPLDPPHNETQPNILLLLACASTLDADLPTRNPLSLMRLIEDGIFSAIVTISLFSRESTVETTPPGKTALHSVIIPPSVYCSLNHPDPTSILP